MRMAAPLFLRRSARFLSRIIDGCQGYWLWGSRKLAVERTQPHDRQIELAAQLLKALRHLRRLALNRRAQGCAHLAITHDTSLLVVFAISCFY